MIVPMRLDGKKVNIPIVLSIDIRDVANYKQLCLHALNVAKGVVFNTLSQELYSSDITFGDPHFCV